jgi:hypothetical protein
VLSFEDPLWCKFRQGKCMPELNTLRRAFIL